MISIFNYYLEFKTYLITLLLPYFLGFVNARICLQGHYILKKTESIKAIRKLIVIIYKCCLYCYTLKIKHCNAIKKEKNNSVYFERKGII